MENLRENTILHPKIFNLLLLWLFLLLLLFLLPLSLILLFLLLLLMLSLYRYYCCCCCYCYYLLLSGGRSYRHFTSCVVLVSYLCIKKRGCLENHETMFKPSIS